MSPQIIVTNKVTKVRPLIGQTVVHADAPIRCPKCGEFRPFFYHFQINVGEPSVLACAEKCHSYLQDQLKSHDGDHFLIRGIEAPMPKKVRVPQKEDFA